MTTLWIQYVHNHYNYIEAIHSIVKMGPCPSSATFGDFYGARSFSKIFNLTFRSRKVKGITKYFSHCQFLRVYETFLDRKKCSYNVKPIYSVRVSRYSFSETVPIFFYRLKKDFILVRSL